MKGRVLAGGCLVLLGCLTVVSCVGLSAAKGAAITTPSASVQERSKESGNPADSKNVNASPEPTPPSQTQTGHTPVAPGSASPAEPLQKAPVELTSAEISREVMLSAGQGSWPVNQRGKVLEVERRLSDSGSPDVFALFAAVPTLADAAVSTLSDFARLFNTDTKPVAFSLKVFHQRDGRLVIRNTIALGNYYVFGSMKTVSIHQGTNLPFAVSVAFQTADGSDDQWVIFSAAGTSRFLLQETLSRSATAEDIDGDGYLDIVTRERGVEEGTGYETFLTWYKWDGTRYVEHRTTNIVRNLRDFLGRAAELISEGRIGAFLSAALTAETLSALRRAGLDDSEIFSRIFRPAPSTPESPNPQVANLGEIASVVFPDIVENPFTQNGPGFFSFPLTARFITSDNTSHFFATRIVLSRNPFVPPEFTFAVVPPGASSSSY